MFSFQVSEQSKDPSTHVTEKMTNGSKALKEFLLSFSPKIEINPPLLAQRDGITQPENKFGYRQL